MLKRYVFVLLLLGGAGLCHAQHAQYDVPEEITRLLRNYLKDSTAEYGPLDAKKWRFFNDSVQIKDMKVGRPIPEYMVKHTILDTCPDTIPFYKIIEPAGRWFVPITAHGKLQYQLGLMKSTNGWGIFQLGSGSGTDESERGIWGPLLNAYPESTGINPILFVESRATKYLYFPQKGPRKMYRVRRGYENEERTVLYCSIDTLDDSRKLIEFWKKSGKKELGVNNKQLINNDKFKTGGDK